MTTDPLARVAELEKCLRDTRAFIVVACGDKAPYVKIALGKIDAALTGTGDDVLAAVEDVTKPSGNLLDAWMTFNKERGSIEYAEGEWEAFVAAIKLYVSRVAKPLPAAPTDGWIEWKGGECPVSGHQNVRVRLRSGKEVSGPANYFQWAHAGDDLDIIAYRLATPTEGRS